jgi:hypothetical protein
MHLMKRETPLKMEGTKRALMKEEALLKTARG